MIFPYLSLATPEIQGNHQMSGSLPDPWAVLPLRGSHRAAFRRKSHYAVMDLRLNPGAVRLLQASCRSGLSTVLAFTADVAPHHRFVPDECVFGCQGASDVPASAPVPKHQVPRMLTPYMYKMTM